MFEGGLGCPRVDYFQHLRICSTAFVFPRLLFFSVIELRPTTDVKVISSSRTSGRNPGPKRATGSCSQHPACPRIERLARGTRSKWASHGPGTTVLLTGGTLGMSNWSRWSIQIYNLMKDNSDGKGKALCVGCVSVLGAGVARTTTEERSKKRR
jgi:hypothetical protein